MKRVPPYTTLGTTCANSVEQLFYGFGMIVFAVAFADGKVQPAEKRELREMIARWAEQIDASLDVSEIIFSIMDTVHSGSKQSFELGIKAIELGRDHLDERLKEKFIYLLEDIARAFPPVTTEEKNLIAKFRHAIGMSK